MLSESQADILEFVANQVVGTTRGNSVTGRLLRVKLKGLVAPDAFAADLAALQPTYLSGWGTPPHDEYAMTFDGLLASSYADRAKVVVLTVLRTWIARRLEDPEFTNFSWSEIKQALPGGKGGVADSSEDQRELRFFDFVVRLAKLAPNATVDRGVWKWTTPGNVETLMEKAGETEKLDDFIATIRAELDREARKIGSPDSSVVATPDELGFDDVVVQARREEAVAEKKVDSRKVMVIHGRDGRRRRAMFDYLRALKLEPIEWSEAVRMSGSASPYVGQVLDAAFANAQAVVALFTGDDEVRLRPHLRGTDPVEPLTPQPRPNVLYEAGLAFGSHPNRVVLVEVGKLRSVSDLHGRHVVRVVAGGDWRHDVADRLMAAGCSVDKGGRDWLEAGEDLEEGDPPDNPPAPETVPRSNGPRTAPDAVEHVESPPAKERLKSYLKDDRSDEIEELLGRLTRKASEVAESLPTNASAESFLSLVTKCESVTVDLVEVIARVAHSGKEKYHRALITCVEDLAAANSHPVGGTVHLLNLRAYPAVLAFYSAGVVAVARSDLVLLRKFYEMRLPERTSDKPLPLFQVLSPDYAIQGDLGRPPPGTRQAAPTSERIFELLKPRIVDLPLINQKRYEEAFARFEYFNQVAKAIGMTQAYPYFGRFAWYEVNYRRNVLAEATLEEITKQATEWPPFKAGLFGADLDAVKRAKSLVDEQVARVIPLMR